MKRSFPPLTQTAAIGNRNCQGNLNETALASYKGLYQFFQMSFRLRSALSTFQQIMDMILQSKKWLYVLVYQDEFDCSAQAVKEHISQVQMVLIFEGKLELP